MNEQVHTDAYHAAVDAAMNELDLILQEYSGLSNRMEQLQAAVEGLKPMMDLDEGTVPAHLHLLSDPMETAAEPLHADQLNLSQPVGVGIPQLVPRKSRESADPIQRRIDSMLGLAVA
jgi:hypothetical protein